MVEIIIAITIASLLVIIVTTVYNISQNIYYRSDTKAEITQNGRVILDRMVREIRQAKNLVTEIPEDNSDPENLPTEIMFQDGHDASMIQYIRYYLDNSNIKRQLIVYYFDEAPEIYFYWHATDKNGNPPTMEILEDRIIGEYAAGIEFWGDKLIKINLYLHKSSQWETFHTAVYGRNL